MFVSLLFVPFHYFLFMLPYSNICFATFCSVSSLFVPFRHFLFPFRYFLFLFSYFLLRFVTFCILGGQPSSDTWEKCHGDVDEAPRRCPLFDSSEMENNTSSVTGIITVIKKRISGNDQGNHINTYFNGTEISTIFDSGSPISTMKHNMATETRIIEIEQREPNNQGYKGRIYPSESEKEECMEPASKKDTLPRKPNTEEIQELLPEFNGSSALSLPETKTHGKEYYSRQASTEV